MSNLSTFQFESNDVTVVIIDHEPWFCLVDVANVLGISNCRDINSRLDPDGVDYIDAIDKLGRMQSKAFISEANLYRTIFQSRKNNAVAFQKFVFETVLPTIRKTGKFEVNPPSPPQVKEIKALQASRAVKEIQENVEHISPRLAQYLIDHCISEVLELQLPAGEVAGKPVLRGVVEIAEEMGFKVNLNNRSLLGKHVKKIMGGLAQTEKRLCSGTMQEINCYPDIPEVREAIASYFIKLS